MALVQQVVNPQQEQCLPHLQEEEEEEAPLSMMRYSRLPAQVSLPAELAAKLERQDSGALDEEGIQADSGPEEDGPLSGQEDGPDAITEPRTGRSTSVVSDVSEEGGRDSGIEAEREPDMVVPDADLVARIVSQVEFYFSDANVAKDKFLLKHIRRNKEGYVSLKLVSSFKKVKQLTKDWRVVLHSLQHSSAKIQINDVATKIRRVEPLPELEDSTPATRAVLAFDLPIEKPCIQSVSQLFSSCGDISFIRVVKEGATVPADLRYLTAKHPALADGNCAWIEFESCDAAKAATDMTQCDGMTVVPILPDVQKKTEKTNQQKTGQQQQQPASRKNSLVNTMGQQQQPGQKGPGSRKNSLAGLNKGRKDSFSGLSPEARAQQQQYMQRQPRRKCLSLPQTQSPNLRELSAVVEARRNRPKSKSCTEFQLGGTPPPTSWVQRHLLAAAAESAASAAAPVVGSRPPQSRSGRVSHGSLPVPEGVVRFPKGPDGSRGFGVGRKRSSAAPEPAPAPELAPTRDTTGNRSNADNSSGTELGTNNNKSTESSSNSNSDTSNSNNAETSS